MYQYFSSQGHIFPKIPSPALIKRIPKVIGTKSSLAAAPFDTADGCCKSLVHSLTHSLAWRSSLRHRRRRRRHDDRRTPRRWAGVTVLAASPRLAPL